MEKCVECFSLLGRIREEFLLVVRIGGIESCGRIVSRNSVFGDQGSDVYFGIFVEQAVMSHAKSDDNIQISMCFIQRACKMGLHMEAPMLSHCGGIPMEVLLCPATLQITEYGSKSFARRIWAKIRASLMSPMQLAIPILCALILRANSMIS